MSGHRSGTGTDPATLKGAFMDDDYDRDSGSASTFLAFILGGLTGAALALLYAPRTGQETRDLLAEKVREGEARAREAKERALARGREAGDEASGYIEKQKAGLDQRK